jgi:hypothetical protein
MNEEAVKNTAKELTGVLERAADSIQDQARILRSYCEILRSNSEGTFVGGETTNLMQAGYGAISWVCRPNSDRLESAARAYGLMMAEIGKATKD